MKGMTGTMNFYKDFLNLTLVQHLVTYWYVWGAFAALSFVILFVLNRKNPRN